MTLHKIVKTPYFILGLSPCLLVYSCCRRAGALNELKHGFTAINEAVISAG